MKEHGIILTALTAVAFVAVTGIYISVQVECLKERVNAACNCINYACKETK